VAQFLELALWIVNGLSQHMEEMKTFNIDIMLISQKHFNEKSYLKLPNYTAYHTNHPAGTARGGAAIIIKGCIKHHQVNNYHQDFLKATSVYVSGRLSVLTISAVHLPTRHTVKQEQF
jgi:hypothetical protein